MIEKRDNGDIWIDGVFVDGLDDCMATIAAKAAGAVLEVGLGVGQSHRALRENEDVRRHVVIERLAELVEHHRRAGALSPSAIILVGEVPAINIRGAFDWVLLDIPNARSTAITDWAKPHLCERNGVIVFGS